ncbi:MAG: GatB/YqeY domain-containing protein [Candidatus Onthovivens sp.]|nr:GatB/YqeY domain-containing protein [Candidatus Onthovivens sp.]
MLIDTLKKENLLALKSKNENKRAVLSVVINKYMILGYEMKAQGKEPNDDDLIKIISKTLKELEEEKKSFENANRVENAQAIQSQIDCIKAYLPAMLSEKEIKEIILGLEDKSIPSVMKFFKQNYNGKCDMALVSKILKSL